MLRVREHYHNMFRASVVRARIFWFSHTRGRDTLYLVIAMGGQRCLLPVTRGIGRVLFNGVPVWFHVGVYVYNMWK